MRVDDADAVGADHADSALACHHLEFFFEPSAFSAALAKATGFDDGGAYSRLRALAQRIAHFGGGQQDQGKIHRERHIAHLPMQRAPFPLPALRMDEVHRHRRGAYDVACQAVPSGVGSRETPMTTMPRGAKKSRRGPAGVDPG